VFFVPSQKFVSIGIAPPHLLSKSRINERNLYELNLKKAGAEIILNSIQDLLKIDIYSNI